MLPADRWDTLPEARRAEVLALLGRLIARGVLADQVAGPGRAGAWGGTAVNASSDPGGHKISPSHLGRDAYVYLLSELGRDFSQFKDGF